MAAITFIFCQVVQLVISNELFTYFKATVLRKYHRNHINFDIFGDSRY